MQETKTFSTRKATYSSTGKTACSKTRLIHYYYPFKISTYLRSIPKFDSSPQACTRPETISETNYPHLIHYYYPFKISTYLRSIPKFDSSPQACTCPETISETNYPHVKTTCTICPLSLKTSSNLYSPCADHKTISKVDPPHVKTTSTTGPPYLTALPNLCSP